MECPMSKTTLHLIPRLQVWISGECGVPLNRHYSQAHSDLEFEYLLGSHLWVLIDLSKNRITSDRVTKEKKNY